MPMSHLQIFLLVGLVLTSEINDSDWTVVYKGFSAMISSNSNLRIRKALLTEIMEPSLNMKWRINNHNRWLLVVNITSTAGNNAKITVPMLAILRTFQNTQSFYWEISISVLPSPLQMHFQMNKRRWETERLAGVLVTMAASKWNAKAQETDRESRSQVDVMELPGLLIMLLHAQFSSLPSPCISTSSESGRGIALQQQGGQRK